MPDVAVGKTAAELEPSLEERLRLTDAVTRASTECGYPAVDVERIALYADLTVDDFHTHFTSKDDCLFAAFNRFLDRFFDHIADESEVAASWPEKVKIVIESGFDFVAELEGASRLFVVDALLAGPAVIELTSASIERAAAGLKHGRVLFSRSADMPDATERTLVAGVVMIASVHLLAEEGYRLPGLAAEAVEMVLTPYVGSDQAHHLAAA